MSTIQDIDDLLGEGTSDWGEGPSDSALSKVSALAQKQVGLQQRVEELEADLKMTKDALRTVQEQELPDALAETGLSEIKLIDGTKVAVTEFVSAHISKARADEAHEWLADNGYADIIKHEVSVRFNKEEDALAHTAVETLRGQGLAPTDKRSVHPSTLRAWAREQTQRGVDIPEQLFGIFIGSKAKIVK